MRNSPLVACGMNNASAIRFAMKISQEGWRPEIPGDWHETIVELIKACWQNDPEARPSFVSIASILEKLMPAAEQLFFETPFFGKKGEHRCRRPTQKSILTPQ